MGVSPLFNGPRWDWTEQRASTIANADWQRSLGVNNMGVRNAGANIANFFLTHHNPPFPPFRRVAP